LQPPGKKWLRGAITGKFSAHLIAGPFCHRELPEAITHLVKCLTNRRRLVFAYETGPCGYELQREITQLGYKTVVIAPALVPRQPGDRVKMNRRDAEKLARLYRAGELTEIRVPIRAEEAAAISYASEKMRLDERTARCVGHRGERDTRDLAAQQDD
jgi:transposase